MPMEFTVFFKERRPFGPDELDAILRRAGGARRESRTAVGPVSTWVEIREEEVAFRAACDGGDRYFALSIEGLRPLLEELSARGDAGRLSVQAQRWDAEAAEGLGTVLRRLPPGAVVQFGGDRYEVEAVPALVDQLVKAGVRGVAFDNVDMYPAFDHLPSDHDPEEAEAFLGAVVEALPDAPAIEAVSVRYIPVDECAWASLAASLRRIPNLRAFRLRSVDIAAERSVTLLASLSDTGLADLRYCGPLGLPGAPRCVRLPAGLTHLALELDQESGARIDDLLTQIRGLPLRRLRLDELPAGKLGALVADVRTSTIADLRVTVVGEDFYARTVYQDLLGSPVRKLRVNVCNMYHSPNWLGWDDRATDLRPVLDALICSGVDAWGIDGYKRRETQASLRLAYRLHAGGSALLPAELLGPAVELAHEFPPVRLRQIAELRGGD